MKEFLKVQKRKIILTLIIHVIVFSYYTYESLIYGSVSGVGYFGQIFSTSIKIFFLINIILPIIIIFISKEAEIWLFGILLHFTYFLLHIPKFFGEINDESRLSLAVASTIITFVIQFFPYWIARGIIGIVNFIKKKIAKKGSKRDLIEPEE